MMKPEPLKGKKKNRFPSYPNVTFYDEETVKAAVEWLKGKIKGRSDETIPQIFTIDVNELIDEAFEDIISEESDNGNEN